MLMILKWNKWGGTKNPDCSLCGPFMHFQMANIAAASQLCMANYDNGSCEAGEWMLSVSLFVIKQASVPWVSLGVFILGTRESFCIFPLGWDTYVSLLPSHAYDSSYF